MVLLRMACVLQAMNLHWQIYWQSQSNLLKKKIGALDSEIQVNFMILMGISALMGVILVMAAHTCYLSCKQKIDKVVPTTEICETSF